MLRCCCCWRSRPRLRISFIRWEYCSRSAYTKVGYGSSRATPLCIAIHSILCCRWSAFISSVERLRTRSARGGFFGCFLGGVVFWGGGGFCPLLCVGLRQD